MKHLFAMAVMALSAVCVSSMAQSAAQKVELYGLTVGEPFTVPPCSPNGSYESFEAATAFTCFWTEKPDLADKPEGELLIKFATPAAFTTTGSVGVVVLNGVLTSIEVQTTGTDSGEQVLSLLTGKLGKPNATHRSPVQNAYGAKFPRISAAWKLGTITVEFDSAPERIDEGEITASTPAGRSFMDAKHHVASTPM